MPYTILKNTFGFLLLFLCSSCGKLAELQNAYLQYDICDAGDSRFQSVNNIETNLRVEVVKPLERAADANYYLAGEVHYYDQYNQLLAIVIYGLGPEETWATKEVFEVANQSVAHSSSAIISSPASGSSICRFEQITAVVAL
jgi:hypothetical protein